MWGSLSRGRRATIKRTALALVIMVGISVAVDKYKKEAVTHREVLPWHQGGYEDHHGDLNGGVVPGGRFARLAGGERLGDVAGGETSSGSSSGSAAEVDGGWVNGTKPEWERDDEARGGDASEPGGGEKTETLGNDVAFIERLAASHEHKTGE